MEGSEVFTILSRELRIGKEVILQRNRKAMARRGTPQNEGAGKIFTSTTGNYSDADRKEKEVRRYCDSGGRIKKPHTYREGCRKYVQGATKLEMEHAARVGEVGRKKLLERLGIREDKRAPVQRGQDQKRKERDKAEDQRTPVPRGRDQKRKEREKAEVREPNAAARTSSPTTKEEKPPLKVGNKKNSKQTAPQSPMEEESSPDMVAVIRGKKTETRKAKGRTHDYVTTCQIENTGAYTSSASKSPAT